MQIVVISPKNCTNYVELSITGCYNHTLIRNLLSANNCNQHFDITMNCMEVGAICLILKKIFVPTLIQVVIPIIDQQWYAQS